MKSNPTRDNPANPSRRLPRSVLPAALLVAALAACTQVPLASLWQLRKFDFEGVDPSELRVALRLPAQVALRPEGLRVQIKVTREGAGAQVEESFFLGEQAAVTTASEALPEAGDRRQPWVVLRLTARESERLLSFRQQLIASKPQEGQGKRRLEVQVDPKLCLRSGAPDPSAPVSAAVRWQPDPGFVMLLQDRTLGELAAALGQPSAALAPCGADLKAHR